MIENNQLKLRELREKEAQEYMKTHTKEDFINEVKNLSNTNPLLYMIIISVLKLKELHIISLEETDDILEKTVPYEEHLIEDFFTAKNKYDTK